MKIGSLFAGYDGIGLAAEALWPDAERAWFVEFDQAPSRILAHHWPTVVNHGDITAVDWDTVEPVDILTGGFPCQDLSHAGKRLGLRPGTRSGLWEHMAYAIDRLRPRLVVIENVRGLLSAEAHSDMERDCWCVGDEREPALRALGAVLGDLAELGYDARWGGVRAADAGAPHGRFRVFIVAQPADADLAGLEGRPAERQRPDQRPAGPGSVGALALLPTATASMATGAGTSGRDGGPNLQTAVGALLPTPKASDGPNGGPGMRNGRGDADALPGVVSLLPTPRAQNGEDRNNLIWARPAGQPQNLENALANFGPYAAAVARWEAVLGRPAPSPTEPGKDGRPRLSPAFVEFMMGLPLGHVTDPAIGLTRAQALKALGNGVVPQQAALALRLLLGLGGATVAAGGALLPTPEAKLGDSGPDYARANRAGSGGDDLTTTVHRMLLPTPNPFHAGNEEDPDEWRRRRADVFKRTGTRHGPALGVVAKSLLPGETPLTPDTYMPED